MKTKLTYIAEDGTSFDTEKECAEYEEKLANKYVVLYKDKETNLIKRRFYNEPLAKRYIANCLHDCYNDCIVGNFKLVHCGKVVEFDTMELSKFVPAHYKIDGDKLNEVFQMCATKNMVIPGYTLHGDYYLADEAISDRNWKEACEMKEEITLPNGKTVIAHTLSKEELETIPQKERSDDYCYWTNSTCCNGYNAWYVGYFGDLYHDLNKGKYIAIRLGFKNPFIN